MRPKEAIYAAVYNSLANQKVMIRYSLDGVYSLYDKTGDVVAKCRQGKPLSKHAFDMGADEVAWDGAALLHSKDE